MLTFQSLENWQLTYPNKQDLDQNFSVVFEQAVMLILLCVWNIPVKSAKQINTCDKLVPFPSYSNKSMKWIWQKSNYNTADRSLCFSQNLFLYEKSVLTIVLFFLAHIKKKTYHLFAEF